MTRCETKRGLSPAAGLLLIAGLVLAQNLQAAAVRECLHHSGSAHSVVGVSAEESGSEAHHGHHAPTSELPAHPDHTSPEPDSRSHEGPCDCLGPCGASSAVHAPASPTESAFADVASRSVVVPEAGDPGFPRHARPFFLPYPNAPPA